MIQVGAMIRVGERVSLTSAMDDGNPAYAGVVRMILNRGGFVRVEVAFDNGVTRAVDLNHIKRLG